MADDYGPQTPTGIVTTCETGEEGETIEKWTNPADGSYGTIIQTPDGSVYDGQTGEPYGEPLICPTAEEPQYISFNQVGGLENLFG